MHHQQKIPDHFVPAGIKEGSAAEKLQQSVKLKQRHKGIFKWLHTYLEKHGSDEVIDWVSSEFVQTVRPKNDASLRKGHHVLKH
jgi:hypothetical protein